MARRAERARAALQEATAGRAFARAVFRLMLATVPGEYASAMFHCAPMPRWGAWLASNGRTLGAELMREISRVHLGMPRLLANPGIKAIPTRGVLPPQAALVRTPFYRLFMRPYRWRHSVALFFWKTGTAPVVDCVFCIYRTASQGDFSEREIVQLTALHPQIDRARRRVARLAEGRATLRSLQHFVRDLPLPALLLNWQLEPLYHNREGVECCARWRNGATARSLKPTCDVPAAVRAECTALKAQWDARLGSHGFARDSRKHTVHHPTAPGMAASVTLLQLGSGLISDPNFLILFEHAAPRGSKATSSQHRALAELTRLTPRQRDIAALAVSGRTNGEIATALGCNLGTVKGGLYSVFKKIGVASRAQLLCRLMENQT